MFKLKLTNWRLFKILKSAANFVKIK